MKLISLNTWGGKYFEPLIKFIKQQSESTDIFCFQEVYDTQSDIKKYIPASIQSSIERLKSSQDSIRANLLDEFINILADYKYFYFPTLVGYDDVPNPVNFDLTCGQAIFVENSIKNISQRNFYVNEKNISDHPGKEFENLSTPLQQITIEYNHEELHIFNFHGTPFPGDKKDTPERLTEAKKVKEIIDKCDGAKILVGDFNLLPDTKSVKTHEKNLISLIKKFNVETTRSNLSPYYGKIGFQKFADYTFVSSDIKVKNFQVPIAEISDHLPMILEFS